MDASLAVWNWASYARNVSIGYIKKEVGFTCCANGSVCAYLAIRKTAKHAHRKSAGGSVGSRIGGVKDVARFAGWANGSVFACLAIEQNAAMHANNRKAVG